MGIALCALSKHLSVLQKLIKKKKAISGLIKKEIKVNSSQFSIKNI